MDEMEAVMAKEDQTVRQNLEALNALRSSVATPISPRAAVRYARFTE